MGTRLGNYELIDRYATGGVAEIYRARDVRSGDVVVIKRLRQDIDVDIEAQAGFIRELQLALMCTHKNLIRGFEKGSQGGIEYGVLEYVDGQDLAHIITRARKSKTELPVPFSTYIVGEILDGLDFAWRLKDANGQPMQLVHRDLSPKNVFVRYDGQVRIGDFGSSLASGERADAVIGTPGYMSPEQARLEPLDQRSDLFAAGLVLYELLAGHPAFDVAGKGDAHVLKVHQRGIIRPIPSSVPEDLRIVVEIATSPDPDDRYPTARDFKKGILATDYAPNQHAVLGVASLVHKLFEAEHSQSRV